MEIEILQTLHFSRDDNNSPIDKQINSIQNGQIKFVAKIIDRDL